MKKKLIIIAGPTGVGKTELSIMLAQKLNGEIISCDSMQIYKHMDIGSAKISKEEMNGIPHHMIDIVSPDEEYSVSEYMNSVKEIIDDISSRGKMPILVGGTGLYVNSIICNMNFTESKKDEDYRRYLNDLAETHGNQHIHEILKECDIKSYNNIHYNNRKRVIRALEVYKLTGKPFSEYSSGDEYYECEYDLFYYVLNMSRERLYDRINRRVEIMMEKGLVEEVKNLKDMGMTSDMQSMKGIGYKEILYYLDNKISLNEAVEMIKQGSRNYAKRQITWFKKDPRAEFIDKDKYKDDKEILDKVLNDIYYK